MDSSFRWRSTQNDDSKKSACDDSAETKEIATPAARNDNMKKSACDDRGNESLFLEIATPTARNDDEKYTRNDGEKYTRNDIFCSYGCSRKNEDGSINCANGYAEYKNECWDVLPFAKKRYTPAEAAKLLNEDNNNVVTITFKM